MAKVCIFLLVLVDTILCMLFLSFDSMQWFVPERVYNVRDRNV